MTTKMLGSLLPVCGILCLFGLGGPLAATGAHAAEDSEARANVGSVERVQQLAEALFGGAARRLEKASPVLRQDLLKTGPKARLEVELRDGSSVRMGEQAELRIDDFVYTPKEKKQVALSALKGAFLFVGNKVSRTADQEVQIKTPVALLGVRGTQVWGGPIDGAFGVLVLEGMAVVTSARGKLSLKAGQGTMIAPDGTLEPRQRWPQAKAERAFASVAFD